MNNETLADQASEETAEKEQSFLIAIQKIMEEAIALPGCMEVAMHLCFYSPEHCVVTMILHDSKTASAEIRECCEMLLNDMRLIDRLEYCIQSLVQASHRLIGLHGSIGFIVSDQPVTPGSNSHLPDCMDRILKPVMAIGKIVRPAKQNGIWALDSPKTYF